MKLAALRMTIGLAITARALMATALYEDHRHTCKLQAPKQSLSATLPRQKPKVSSAIQDALDAVRLKAIGGKPLKPAAIPEEGLPDASPSDASTARAPGVVLRDRAVSRIGLSPLGHQRTL